MKNFKSIFALFLALALTMAFSTTAFAAENEESTIPAHATQHTIEVELLPEESAVVGDPSVAPCIWDQHNHNMVSNSITYIPFSIPDRYMAFETSALAQNGSTVNCNFSTELLLTAQYDVAYASTNHLINGQIAKVDWIDIGAGNYVFKITNPATVAIRVTLTYYSWS